jgi:hypothetical protein
MILIAESGSTKTNWLTEKKDLYETIGFNPLFHTSYSIFTELSKQKQLLERAGDFTKVFFYGASCSSPERNQIVFEALQRYFSKAEIISVDHDLKAAAIATYEGRTCISCILGTGSNSCLYDGKSIYEEVPALSFILGDEGSGAYFGKKLIALYLYKELPEATMKRMKELAPDKNAIFEATYQKPHPNVYLATFAKVMSEGQDRAFMDELAREGFTEFFKHHVCCYKNYQQYPVHFVGSIAYFFKDVLQQVANSFGAELGVVDRNPVYRLLDWHVRNDNGGK